jgi:hypothetical protein
MKTLATFPAALLLALSFGTPAVAQNNDDADKIMNDCSDSDLPPEVVDYCLRRVHGLNETNPTPDSEALEAQLQRRADDLDRSGKNQDWSNDQDQDNSGRDDRSNDSDRDSADRDRDDRDSDQDHSSDNQGYDDNTQPDDSDEDRPPRDDNSDDDDSNDQAPRQNSY